MRNTQTLTHTAYKHRYGKETQAQPGINLGTAQNTAWFAASKLRILPYQIYRRPVPDHLTDGMLKNAAKTPAESETLVRDVFRFMNVQDRSAKGFTSFVSSYNAHLRLLPFANPFTDCMSSFANHPGSPDSQEHDTSIPVDHLW
jgi:hypothetical protein